VIRDQPLVVRPGASVIAPVLIDGLPPEIYALGITWQRKVEFHLTAASRNTLEHAGRERPDLWRVVREVADGRSVAPITARREIRRVSDRERPGLETLVVMVGAPALGPLYRELSIALGADLHPPPAHVTLYSTDPEQGIGLDHERHLAERSALLTNAELESLSGAIPLL
jgi:hypothetical protein